MSECKGGTEVGVDWLSGGTSRPWDHDFVAAFNAQVVLALLDRVETAEDQAAEDRVEWQEMKGRATQRFRAYQQKKRELRQMEIRAERAEQALQRVREVIEREKHWNDECGWDVPLIKAIRALEGNE